MNENLIKRYNTSNFFHSKPSTSQLPSNIKPLLPAFIKNSKFFEKNDKKPQFQTNPIEFFSTPASSLFTPSNFANSAFLSSFIAASAQFNTKKQPNKNYSTPIPQMTNVFPNFPLQQTAIKNNLMNLIGNSLINPFLFCNPTTIINTATIKSPDLNNITAKETSETNISRKRKLKCEKSKENFSDNFLNKKTKQFFENSETATNQEIKSVFKDSSLLWRPYDHQTIDTNKYPTVLNSSTTPNPLQTTLI